MSCPIRVAICGGGLAGASLMHALLKFSHLDVHIFESAATFKEAGMAISVARNALATLDLLGPRAAQCLERAGAVPMRGLRFLLAQGERQGEIIDEDDVKNLGRRLTSIVHRAAFLRELLAGLPPQNMHPSKKLNQVDRKNDGCITLHFADSTIHECDILIGADGIHSTVRKLILGEDPAASPRNTGVWIIVTLHPYADAQAIIGDNVNTGDPREYAWIGYDTYLMHNLLSDGQLVQFIIGSHDKEAELSDHWDRTVSAEEIKKLYRNWPPHLSKAVNELLCNKAEQRAIYLWDHPPARSYVSGPLCVIGDAAHASTPWQGSGGGMSIEDSLILSTLLGRAKTLPEAITALKVYDQVRRPRTQRIVQSGRDLGTLLTSSNEKTGLYVKEPEKLLRRWDFILDIDIEEHCNEAIEMMEEELKIGV
ncbi:hypothetical protein DL770_009138 [Monosporascus sp. CRB-9-2]|nr:hypothetical protein DL770_009138 [Monosporascus sp. CRB-9-2]